MDGAPEPSDLKAISVPMGPGAQGVTGVGLTYAQALGRKFNIPVIPVNLIEAQVFAPRFSLANAVYRNEAETNEEDASFPYLSVNTSHGHQEIVIVRGVGCHTVLGLSIDISAEKMFRNVVY